MKRISNTPLAWSALLLAVLAGPARATPDANGATIQTRTFNDCPISTVTTSNNYPTLITISDTMDPLCVGFANLHSWSFSADAGATSAVFNNNSNYRFSASVKIEGPGEGEGGLRISPWYGQYVDGRFMINATTGEIACFGGAIPFYSFTVHHGITYVKGTTIRLQATYRARDLYSTDPATIQYRVVYNNVTYDSPEIDFGQQNPNECEHGEYGMLNDGRVGGYFQPRANTGAQLSATWSSIEYEVLPEVGTPIVDAAVLNTRTFNDCPISTLTTNNAYPALITIQDQMDPLCVGFANLHSWSFSEDGGTSAAVFQNNSNFHYLADFQIDGPGEGEGGLRISPWYGQYVDGRFMANATTGEIACFGGALPFYSFTVHHGITYTRGNPIHLDVIYRSNQLISTDPASMRYRVVYNGNTYDSPELDFGEQNASECDGGTPGPHSLWGMLNDGRVGGYFQPRANTGASLTGSWGNIRYSTCTDPVPIGFKFEPKDFNLNSHGHDVTAKLTPTGNADASDIDISSVRLNGVPIASSKFSKGDCDDPDTHDQHGHIHHHHHRCNRTLIAKFDRGAFAATLNPGSSVPVLISGLVGNQCFEQVINIKVKTPHMEPDNHAVIAPTSVVQLQWDPADGEGSAPLSLISSTDGGATWQVEVVSMPNTGRYAWKAPESEVPSLVLAVARLSDSEEDGVTPDVEVAESGNFTVGTAPAGVGDVEEVAFALRGVNPNPSKGSFTVAFSLPNAVPTTLKLFDISGREVMSRQVGSLGKGQHRITLGSRENLSAGIYLVRLSQVGGPSFTTRAIVIQ